jgi:hypothetical protein
MSCFHDVFAGQLKNIHPNVLIKVLNPVICLDQELMSSSVIYDFKDTEKV